MKANMTKETTYPSRRQKIRALDKQKAVVRSTREVLEDHLTKFHIGKLEEDLVENYAQDVVVLSTFGVYHGHDGITHLTRLLTRDLPSAEYEFYNLLVEGEHAFVEWSANSNRTRVRDGVDSYLIRGGQIVMQTIHYTVEPKDRQ